MNESRQLEDITNISKLVMTEISECLCVFAIKAIEAGYSPPTIITGSMIALSATFVDTLAVTPYTPEQKEELFTEYMGQMAKRLYDSHKHMRSNENVSPKNAEEGRIYDPSTGKTY